MKNKKTILLVLIAILFIICGCEQKNNLEKILLAGHSWGETVNESNSIGMTDVLLGYKVYFTSKTKYNDNNKLNEIYYCIKENEDGTKVTEDDYNHLVNKFSSLIGKKSELETKNELTFNTWYDGSIKYELEFRDESKIKNSTSDNIIYINISNDKY